MAFKVPTWTLKIVDGGGMKNKTCVHYEWLCLMYSACIDGCKPVNTDQAAVKAVKILTKR